jgi:predicted DNA-binding transcriptional regulator
MSKDQAIGGAILVVCLLVAIVYAVLLLFPGWAIELLNLDLTGETLRLYAVAVPVFIAFLAILFIGAWIGWTMATTPPPKPIEEITTEMQETKEEMKAEEPAETKMPEAPEEEKMPEKKRKS